MMIEEEFAVSASEHNDGLHGGKMQTFVAQNAQKLADTKLCVARETSAMAQEAALSLPGMRRFLHGD
jgi:hypothetical protein